PRAARSGVGRRPHHRGGSATPARRSGRDTVAARCHTTVTSSATPLLEPREGLPDVVADADALDGVVLGFTAGHGPVAVDDERASGYRYGQRAYLVQLRREGAGTALSDPIACPDLSPLGAALADAEWV